MIRIRSAAFSPLAALVMLGGLSTAALAAGQISEDVLNADRKSCQSACTNHGQSGDFCSTYCDCTVKGIGDQLTVDEYRTLTEAADKKLPAPQPAADKLKQISNACRTEMGKPAN